MTRGKIGFRTSKPHSEGSKKDQISKGQKGGQNTTKLEVVSIINTYRIFKKSVIKRQIPDLVKLEEKTKASFTLFTRDLPKPKQHRKVENKRWTNVNIFH